MPRTQPIPLELWEQIPPHVQAVLCAVGNGYERRIAALEQEVAGPKLDFIHWRRL